MHVTAILLVRGGADRAARVVSAVQDQTRRPDHVVVVDSLHDPVTSDLLRDLLGADAHLAWVEPGSPVAVAVRAALDVEPPGGAVPPEDRWLWLLTDEGAPEPDALRLLLAEVETAPSVGVAGCSSVAWDDDHQLLDVGTSVTRGGSRIRGVDLREIPQGQYDDRSDVYAVPLPGMLVRAALHDALGGFDPALRGAREDLDLCRRVHLAGRRVVVVPGARVARFVPAPTEAAFADRADAVHLRLSEAPLVLLLPALIWTLLATPLRAAWRLVLKQPGLAAQEALGALSALASPLDVARARARQRRGRTLPRRLLRPLRPSARQIRWQRREDLLAYRFWTDAFVDVDDVPRLPTRREPGLPVTSLTDAEAEADVGLVPVRVRRRPPVLAAATAVLGVLAASVVASRDLLGHPFAALRGAALLPAPERLSALWTDATTSWRPVGLGAEAAADPFLQVLTLLSAPLDASPRLAVLAVLVLAVPVSAWTAWLAAGTITRSRLLRPWAGLVWATCPVALASVGEGRIGYLVAHAVLPLWCLALARAVGVPRFRAPLQVPSTGVTTALLAAAAARDAQARRPRARVTAAAAAAVLFAVLVAAAPWTALPLLLLGGITAAMGPVALRMNRRARRRARLILALSGALGVAATAPWWWAVVREPRLLLADAAADGSGPPGDAAGPDAFLTGGLPLADLLGGADGAVGRRLAAWLPGLTPGQIGVVLTAAVLAVVVPAAVLALAAASAAGRRRPVAGVAVLCAMVGAAVGLTAARTVLDRSASAPTGGWAGAGLGLVVLGTIVAALVAADAVRRWIRRRRTGWARTALAVPAAAALLLGPLVTLVAWSWSAPQGGVTAVDGDVMTVVGAAEAVGPAATRTLVLQVDREVSWSLLRTPGPRLGQRSAAWSLARGDRRDGAVVAPVVSRLLSDTGADVRDDLARLAVGTVMLVPPLDLAAQASLDSTPGLARVGGDDEEAVTWRVDLDAVRGPTRPARAWLESADGVVALTPGARPDRFSAVLADAASPRRLVLAEHADDGWRAWLDGRRLPPRTAEGWAQAFDVPASGGTLVVRHRDATALRLQRLAWVALALAVAVAVPVPRRRRPPAPPRPSRPVDRMEASDEPRARVVTGVADEEALARWETGSRPVQADPDAAAEADDAGPEPDHGDDPDLDLRQPTPSAGERGAR